MTLVSGIFNLLWALYLFGFFCMGGLATMGLGLICLPVAIYPLVVGILEVVQFSPLNQMPPRYTKLPSWLAVLQIVSIIVFNPVALAAGIVGLVAANNPQVRTYLSGNRA